jgi:hypothetical protein
VGDNHMEEHVWDARYENALFLTRDAGLHPERAARRLGMTLEAFNKMMERGRGKSDTRKVTSAGAREGSEAVLQVRGTGP